MFTTVAFLGCLLFAFFGLTRLVFAIVDGRLRAAAGVPGIFVVARTCHAVVVA
jgi:hypothetical protein